MRTNLKVFRVKNGLSQAGIAEKIGCARGTYSAIENGTRNGSKLFWEDLQDEFEIPDSEMWALMMNE